MTVLDNRASAPPARQADADADLGFGAVVARESRQRLLNRDGTFNVRREGLRFWESLSAYHYLLTISWPKFFGFVVMTFLATNAFFATLYMLAGEGALNGTHADTIPGRFLEEFFFSVHTLATIGYGTIAGHAPCQRHRHRRDAGRSGQRRRHGGHLLRALLAARGQRPLQQQRRHRAV